MEYEINKLVGDQLQKARTLIDAVRETLREEKLHIRYLQYCSTADQQLEQLENELALLDKETENQAMDDINKMENGNA